MGPAGGAGQLRDHGRKERILHFQHHRTRCRLQQIGFPRSFILTSLASPQNSFNLWVEAMGCLVFLAVSFSCSLAGLPAFSISSTSSEHLLGCRLFPGTGHSRCLTSPGRAHCKSLCYLVLKENFWVRPSCSCQHYGMPGERHPPAELLQH